MTQDQTSKRWGLFLKNCSFSPLFTCFLSSDRMRKGYAVTGFNVTSSGNNRDTMRWAELAHTGSIPWRKSLPKGLTGLPSVWSVSQVLTHVDTGFLVPYERTNSLFTPLLLNTSWCHWGDKHLPETSLLFLRSTGDRKLSIIISHPGSDMSAQSCSWSGNSWCWISHWPLRDHWLFLKLVVLPLRLSMLSAIIRSPDETETQMTGESQHHSTL